MTKKLTTYHEWLKTHTGSLDEYFTDVQGLTPYDKGRRAEPRRWEERHFEDENDYGKVDFNAEDDFTIATLYIEREADGSYVLRGHTNQALRVEIESDPDDDTVKITMAGFTDVQYDEDDGEEGCDSFEADGSELCARCNKPREAHYD